MNIVVSALIAIFLSVSSLLAPVYAGTLTGSKVTISDSRAGQSGVSHTFTFGVGTTGTIQTVILQYCTTPSGSCTAPSGIITTTGSQGSVTGLGASTTDFTVNGTFTLTVTSPTSVTSGTTVIIPYTTLTNPTTINSSFFVRIKTIDSGAAGIDSTVVAFATVTTTSLIVSADVGATFGTTLVAVTSGSVNGQVINLSTTTASSIPFGPLAAGVSKIAAHDITVSTNATNGYSITVKSGNPPLVDNANNIDSFSGTNAIPTTWSSPAGSSVNVNTGFLGYTTEDSSLCTGTPNRFASNKWAGFDTSDYELVCNPNAVLTGETTRLGWQIEVNGLQPAGSYAGTFIIVVTPTY